MPDIKKLLLFVTGALPALAAHGRSMASQNPGNLNLRLTCFHKCLNLITFGLAEVYIGHGLLRLVVKSL
jgi:hypothetical protein